VPGALTYLLSIYQKNFNQTIDSLINQYSVADSSFMVPNLQSNQKYSYAVSIQPSLCNAESMPLSNMIYLSTTTSLSTNDLVDFLDIKVYPTLCENELFLNDCYNAKFSIFNIWGKIQFSGINTTSLISVASLLSGIYFLKVEVNQNIFVT